MRALLLLTALVVGCSSDPAASTRSGDDASAADVSASGERAPVVDVGQLDATTTEAAGTAGTGGTATMGSGGAGGALAGDAGPVGGAGAGGAQPGSGGAGGGPGSGGAGGAAPTFPTCSDPEAARIGSTNCVRRQPDPDGFFSASRKGTLTCALCTSYQANGLPLHYVRGCALGGTYCVASSCNECE